MSLSFNKTTTVIAMQRLVMTLIKKEAGSGIYSGFSGVRIDGIWGSP
jgi:hypothetical protein